MIIKNYFLRHLACGTFHSQWLCRENTEIYLRSQIGELFFIVLTKVLQSVTVESIDFVVSQFSWKVGTSYSRTNILHDLII